MLWVAFCDSLGPSFKPAWASHGFSFLDSFGPLLGPFWFSLSFFRPSRGVSWGLWGYLGLHKRRARSSQTSHFIFSRALCVAVTSHLPAYSQFEQGRLRPRTSSSVGLCALQSAHTFQLTATLSKVVSDLALHLQSGTVRCSPSSLQPVSANSCPLITI